MTREDKLYTMRMQDLVVLAEKLGIKINTKAAKSKAVEKILEAEKIAAEQNAQTDNWEKEADAEKAAMKKKQAENNKIAENAMNKKQPKLVPMPGADKLADLKAEVTGKPAPKRGALIPYNGKSQNICAWAKELGKSANTLYARIYKLGWTIEKAFTK